MSKTAKIIARCWDHKSWRCSASDIKLFSVYIGMYLGTDLQYKVGDLFWTGFKYDRNCHHLDSDGTVLGHYQTRAAWFITKFKVLRVTPCTILVQCIKHMVWFSNCEFFTESRTLWAYKIGTTHLMRPGRETVAHSNCIHDLSQYIIYKCPLILESHRPCFFIGHNGDVLLRIKFPHEYYNFHTGKYITYPNPRG